MVLASPTATATVGLISATLISVLFTPGTWLENCVKSASTFQTVPCAPTIQNWLTPVVAPYK
jgi:hypothetical protein